jgi:hypothetical protein
MRYSMAKRCEAQLACVMCHVGHPYSPPLPCFTCLICGESYMYRVQRNNSSVHSVTVTLSCGALVRTTSSSSSSSTSSHFFFLPWKRESWAFFGCHYASFLTRSLGFLKLFSLERLWPPLAWSSLLPDHHETIWSEWTWAWWSPLS